MFLSRRLPQLARSLGQAKHAFEDALGRTPVTDPPRWLDQMPRPEERVASLDAISAVYGLDHEKANSR